MLHYIFNLHNNLLLSLVIFNFSNKINFWIKDFSVLTKDLSIFSYRNKFITKEDITLYYNLFEEHFLKFYNKNDIALFFPHDEVIRKRIASLVTDNIKLTKYLGTCISRKYPMKYSLHVIKYEVIFAVTKNQIQSILDRFFFTLDDKYYLYFLYLNDDLNFHSISSLVLNRKLYNIRKLQPIRNNKFFGMRYVKIIKFDFAINYEPITTAYCDTYHIYRFLSKIIIPSDCYHIQDIKCLKLEGRYLSDRIFNMYSHHDIKKVKIYITTEDPLLLRSFYDPVVKWYLFSCHFIQ